MSHHYRINGSMIQQFSGKPVSLIGTVSKVKMIIFIIKNINIKSRFIHQEILSIWKRVINNILLYVCRKLYVENEEFVLFFFNKNNLY
jgi:hypothetical protein